MYGKFFPASESNQKVSPVAVLYKPEINTNCNLKRILLYSLINNCEKLQNKIVKFMTEKEVKKYDINFFDYFIEFQKIIILNICFITWLVFILLIENLVELF